jgi:NitT/TauT family transport system permease protein
MEIDQRRSPERIEDRGLIDPVSGAPALSVKPRFERWFSLLVIILFLLVWEWLARTARVSALFFPAPTATLERLVDWTLTGELAAEFAITFKRVVLGFVYGGGAGLLLGLAMGWSSRLRTMLDPIVAALHPVPKLAVLPVILILFGIGESSRLILISISTFFPMFISSMAAVLQINPTFFEVARNYGAGRWQIFRRVVVPGSMPIVLSGARLALNLSLSITMAVELRFADTGLGAVLWLSWETLRTTYLYATVLILALLGIGFNWSLIVIKKRLVPWHQEHQ